MSEHVSNYKQYRNSIEVISYARKHLASIGDEFLQMTTAQLIDLRNTRCWIAGLRYSLKNDNGDWVNMELEFNTLQGLLAGIQKVESYQNCMISAYYVYRIRPYYTDSRYIH